MSFKPLSCHLSPDDSHSLSGSHLKVFHDARTWMATAAFVMAPSTVMSAETVLFLGRWCIRGRLVGKTFKLQSRNKQIHFLAAELSRDRQAKPIGHSPFWTLTNWRRTNLKKIAKTCFSRDIEQILIDVC